MDWNSALEAVAEELLTDARITAPPVDALLIARRLNIVVAMDRQLQPRGTHKRLGGRPSIFIRPDDRPERLQWAVAHELGEAVAYRVGERLGIVDDELSAAVREQWANLLASRLLLPQQWFFDDVRRFEGDLLELKSLYRTGSHEAIAWRMLDMPEPTIITIFDQGNVTGRRSNSGFRPPRLESVEQNCWRRVHEHQRSHQGEQGGIQVQCWPVHRPGWKREVLRTTMLDEFAGVGKDDWD